MNYKDKIAYLILGFILGGMITYITMHKKPPNLRDAKAKTVHCTKTDINGKDYVVTHVTVTCYQPTKQQCDKDPLTTSDGSKINLRELKKEKIRWCAMSRDLLYLLPKDKPNYIWVDGYGLYEVRDVMNKRYKHSIDLLQHPSKAKMILKKNIKIKIFT